MDNYTEIGRLYIRKDTGSLTKQEVTGFIYNFLQKCVNKVKEKKMNKSIPEGYGQPPKQVTFCPVYSSMAMIPDKFGFKPVGIQGTCYKEKCGWWRLCPANENSLLLDVVIRASKYGKIAEDIIDPSELGKTLPSGDVPSV